MSTYTVGLVERLLRHFLDVRYLLDVNVQKLNDTSVVRLKEHRTKRELPLGMSISDTQDWPFRERRHARSPIDGKARARAREELHCAILDIEEAFPRISDEDQELIIKYHILQTHTLDELVRERQLSSRGAMQRRILRAVERLRREMERGYDA
jgi:hypothetical protein